MCCKLNQTAGDLFDFNFEVEPILEVLMGKVLDQGLMEVCVCVCLFVCA